MWVDDPLELLIAALERHRRDLGDHVAGPVADHVGARGSRRCGRRRLIDESVPVVVNDPGVHGGELPPANLVAGVRASVRPTLAPFGWAPTRPAKNLPHGLTVKGAAARIVIIVGPAGFEYFLVPRDERFRQPSSPSRSSDPSPSRTGRCSGCGPFQARGREGPRLRITDRVPIGIEMPPAAPRKMAKLTTPP
jgi:hypothetical protein